MSSQQNIARAPARSRARLLGHKLNHSRCGSERARRRCGGSAETPPSCMPPMVTPLANVGGLVRRPVSASLLSAPPPCFLPVGVHGRPPARIRLPKLAPAPSNAHEQPYPPTPQKKIRARAKAATKKGRAAASGAPTCRWTQPRAALTAQAAGRWRAHMPQQHLHCKNLLQNGGSVSVACARPLSARRCLRLPRARSFASVAILRGSQVLLRAASAPVILAHPHPFSRPYPRTFRAHTDDIQCLFPRPPTHLPRTF